MIFKNSYNYMFNKKNSTTILVHDKFSNEQNTLKLKYVFKYLGLNTKKLIGKIRHNKLFFLVTQQKIIIRVNSKQAFSSKFNGLAGINLNKLNLYKNFTSFIFKSGKKYIWEKIISDLFLLIKKNLKISQNIILLKIFLRLYSKIEIKKIKTRKKTSLVPVFISVRRRFFLALKWLLIAVNKNKLQISLKEKLFLEIFKLTKNKECESLKQLQINNDSVYSNRANFHYRW